MGADIYDWDRVHGKGSYAAMADAQEAVNDCEHHFISEHVPGHLVYWIRQCSMCHAVDWGDLDREIRELLPDGSPR